jgi:CheY-like chemotaxis protein
MTRAKEKILIVDDSPPIRTTMSLVLAEMGYCVRTAEDGFAALREVRQGMPDILLSDMNMPGMSGFELLTVFRRRFPEIKTIAMSGDFLHGEAPPGIIADAFFQKGKGLGELIGVIVNLALTERRAPHCTSDTSSLNAYRRAQDDFHEADGTLSCPECLRTIEASIKEERGKLIATLCTHCGSPIQSPVFKNSSKTPLQEYRHEAGAAFPLETSPAFWQ